MYTIFCDDYLLHSNIPDYQLEDVRLVMEVNNPGSLEFEISPGHPNYDALGKITPQIIVQKAGVTYWKGRIREDNYNIEGTRKIYAEGKLKALQDTMLRPGVFDGTAAQVFASYLTFHNLQVSNNQMILPGNVTVSGDVYRELKNHETTYSRIQDLVSTVGGYLRMRYESDGDYLDWVEDFTTVSTQEINLGTNVLDLADEITTDTLYTACIPLGARQTDENGTQTDERLTVESIQGVDYVYDADAVAEYGWIYAPISDTTWDDITQPANLLAKANAYLADHKGMISSLTITALDLAYVGQADSFNFCEYIQVNSAAHGISGQFLLSRVEVDITNPANTKIVLGGSVQTLTDRTKQSQDSVTITINDLISALTGTNVNLGNEISARERYIRYENGLIEIGETGSNLKMRLSNTELSFWESLNGIETRVAYIANPTGNPGDSKLYIENGEVVQELKFGNFVWAKRDNGNMSLMYRG